MTTSSPYELWQQAEGDGEKYRALLREHGHLIDRKPCDDPNLPCGWPGRRAADQTNPRRPHMDITDRELDELSRESIRCAIDDLISERGTQSDHLWDQFGDRIEGLSEDASNALHNGYVAALRRIRDEHFPATSVGVLK